MACRDPKPCGCVCDCIHDGTAIAVSRTVINNYLHLLNLTEGIEAMTYEGEVWRVDYTARDGRLCTVAILAHHLEDVLDMVREALPEAQVRNLYALGATGAIYKAPK